MFPREPHRPAARLCQALILVVIGIAAASCDDPELRVACGDEFERFRAELLVRDEQLRSWATHSPEQRSAARTELGEWSLNRLKQSQAWLDRLADHGFDSNAARSLASSDRSRPVGLTSAELPAEIRRHALDLANEFTVLTGLAERGEVARIHESIARARRHFVAVDRLLCRGEQALGARRP